MHSYKSNYLQRWYVKIEDNTWVHIDRKFLFQCSARKLTRSLFSLARYQVKHEKRNSISTSSHVLLCLWLFWRFSEDSRTLSEDFWRFSKSCPKIRQLFPTILRKISEDFQRKSMISEEEPMMFWPYRNKSKFFLRYYVIIAMVIFLVTIETPISSHVEDKNRTFIVCGKYMIF